MATGLLVSRVDFKEVPSDTLFILTESVDALLLYTDHNTTVASLSFRLLLDYLSSKGRGLL